MAKTISSLAKETDTLQSRFAGATAKSKGLVDVLTGGLTHKIKGWAVKGLLAKEILSAVVIGAVLLLLAAAYMGLAKVMDPALAALATGGGILLLIGAGAWWATRE